jgi:hypothetical protein
MNEPSPARATGAAGHMLMGLLRFPFATKFHSTRLRTPCHELVQFISSCYTLYVCMYVCMIENATVFRFRT